MLARADSFAFQNDRSYSSAMGKGDETRERIIHRAMALASRDGLEGVTIGALADDMGLSKSGLFGHFGSKEELEVAILERAADLFTRKVLAPAFQMPRGEPRLRALFERWLVWWKEAQLPGGCIFVAAGVELDDKPGKARDLLVQHQKVLLESLATVAEGGIQQGHFRKDLDPRQLAHDLYAIVLGYHQLQRLLREKSELQRAHTAFERLLEWARKG